MIDRRLLGRAFLVSAAFALVQPAWALDAKPFNQAAFDAAKAAGKPILIEVTAPWCSTCKAQKPILSELTAKPKFKELVIFEIDFDSQKELLRELGVQSQSTLITYKGAKEVGRSTGDTRRVSIEDMLNKSI